MWTPTKERGRQSLESSRSSLNRVSPGSTTRGESPAQSEVNKDEEEVNLEVCLSLLKRNVSADMDCSTSATSSCNSSSTRR